MGEVWNGFVIKFRPVPRVLDDGHSDGNGIKPHHLSVSVVRLNIVGICSSRSGVIVTELSRTLTTCRDTDVFASCTHHHRISTPRSCDDFVFSVMASEAEPKLRDPVVLAKLPCHDLSISELCFVLKTRLVEAANSSMCVPDFIVPTWLLQ